MVGFSRNYTTWLGYCSVLYMVVYYWTSYLVSYTACTVVLLERSVVTPFFLQPVARYCKSFYETHGITGILATLMGLYVLGLAIAQMVGDLW